MKSYQGPLLLSLGLSAFSLSAPAQSRSLEKELAQVETLYREGRFYEAYENARAVVAAVPSSETALFWLGVTAQKNGQIDEAEKAYLDAVSAKPAFAAALNNLGDIFEIRENWQRAIGYYQAAIRVDSRLAAPHASLGDIYRKNAVWARAVEHYQAALDLDPKDALTQSYLDVCRQALEEESAGAVRAGTLRALSGLEADVRRRSSPLKVRGFDVRRLDEPVEPQRLAFRVAFARNQYLIASLPAAAQAQLQEVAAVLSSDDWKGRKLILEGNTCSCGREDANQELGKKRAVSIRQYLIEKQVVRPEDVSVVSFGDRRPVMASSQKVLNVDA